MRAGQHALDGQRLLLPRGRIEQRPFARSHSDGGQLLARGAELVHMPRGGERVGARRHERLERCFVRVDLAHRRLFAPDAALRAAVGNDGDVAEAQRDRAHGMGHVVLERRAADDGRAEERRVDAEILGQRQHRQPALGWSPRTGRRHPSGSSPQSSSARLVPCAIRSMTERPSATWPRSDSATPTIAALPRLSPSITRPPPERTRDRVPPRRRAGARGSARAARCVTCSGAMSSTRLIRRKPSSQSTSATLKGLPSAGCTTVVAWTVPSPLLTRHSSRSLPVNGQSTRG